MRIDSHQHFWRFNPADYGWMKSDWPIRRDFLPVDLEKELRACNRLPVSVQGVRPAASPSCPACAGEPARIAADRVM